MSLNATSETAEWYKFNINYELDPKLRFWLFFIFDIPAIPCTVFVLYHLLRTRDLRQKLHNHTTIILLLLSLIYEVIDFPIHLQFLSTGIVRPSTPALCLTWWFIDWSFFYAIIVIVMFAAIERHLLVFHSRLFATTRGRLILHYVPLGLTLSFVLLFYFIAIYMPICESTFDYTLNLCGMNACYSTISFFSTVEQFLFSTLPSVLIVIFSIALLIRVIWQKYRVLQVVNWHKQRKLAIQMISVSFLFSILCLPLSIVYLGRIYGHASWGDDVLPLFYFISYFPILLLPYLCLNHLPNLQKRIRRRHDRRIHVLTLTHRVNIGCVNLLSRN